MKGQPPVVAIVDDEAEVLRAVRRLLRTEGYDVVTYASGREFMTGVVSLAPVCVVLDLHMPGMSGFDVLNALHVVPAGQRPPVIVLTGNDAPGDRERALSCGARAFLCKPADAETLLRAISAAIAPVPHPGQP